MKRRLFLGLLLAGLILPTLGAGTAKATVLGCSDISTHSRFNGMALGSPLTSSGTYITAFFDVGEWHFNPCTTGEIIKHNGAFGWVMFQSAVNGGFFQIGITDCDDDAFSFCHGTSNPYYFFAMNTCQGQKQYLDIGPADWNAHRFSIIKGNPVGSWGFRIDGVNEYTIPTGDSRITCWANGDTTAEWAFETWDGGDGLGHLSPTSQHPSDVTSAQVQFSGEAAPHSPQWNGNNACTLNQYGANHHVCDVLGTDRFEVWSTG